MNNAGVMYQPLLRTRESFELQFGASHLGCFALTALLRAKLAQTPGARVVVTSSLAQRSGKIDWDDRNAERSYNPATRYSMSKLANTLFMLELDRRLRAAGGLHRRGLQRQARHATGARHLVPLTLELGGKSPFVPSETADMTVSAQQLMSGKTPNAGQFCRAPDHGCAPPERISEFVEAARQATTALFPTLKDNRD